MGHILVFSAFVITCFSLQVTTTDIAKSGSRLEGHSGVTGVWSITRTSVCRSIYDFYLSIR